jgi:UDP-N-acetylglucosamine transferase subunit ALG13
VIVAATGVQRALLQEEFASLTFVDLPGYRVKYGKNRAITIFRLIASIPKILIHIKQERAWLRRFAASEGIDLVISDNRYGLTVPGVFCVFITHQLLIRTPFGRPADLLLQRINYRFIDRYSRCWVPDIQGADALAGELSNPGRMPRVRTRYLGVLSRMQGGAAADGGTFWDDGSVMEREASADMTDLLVLLSGPEPQRSLLERRILGQVSASTGRMVVVRGLPGGGKKPKNIPAGVTVYDHLPSPELERVLAGARLVVARSGYSTVMDLVRMRKRALLIPTPGQTEQEYLGRYLAAKGWVVCVQQNKFSLDEALRVGAQASSWPADDAGERLRAEVLSVLAQSRSALG